MSEVVSILLDIGKTVGWDAMLFALAVYQLYCPNQIHPNGGTKLQQLLKATDPAVVTTLEAIAEEIDDVDENAIRELFNGDELTTSELKDDSAYIKNK